MSFGNDLVKIDMIIIGTSESEKEDNIIVPDVFQTKQARLSKKISGYLTAINLPKVKSNENSTLENV